jgi:hypothetical protein
MLVVFVFFCHATVLLVGFSAAMASAANYVATLQKATVASVFRTIRNLRVGMPI